MAAYSPLQAVWSQSSSIAAQLNNYADATAPLPPFAQPEPNSITRPPSVLSSPAAPTFRTNKGGPSPLHIVHACRVTTPLCGAFIYLLFTLCFAVYVNVFSTRFLNAYDFTAASLHMETTRYINA
jgi:hypothetical protein